MLIQLTNRDNKKVLVNMAWVEYIRSTERGGCKSLLDFASSEGVDVPVKETPSEILSITHAEIKATERMKEQERLAVRRGDL